MYVSIMSGGVCMCGCVFQNIVKFNNNNNNNGAYKIQSGGRGINYAQSYNIETACIAMTCEHDEIKKSDDTLGMGITISTIEYTYETILLQLTIANN